MLDARLHISLALALTLALTLALAFAFAFALLLPSLIEPLTSLDSPKGLQKLTNTSQ